ncbi:MAG: STAS domain-containing protein [Actinobacteria bacterium]|nr:STAS domain-containing protein [Actinomycetota bacterium]MDI6830501.1 STAS domain-containing protein [Actinomycetota bacterium]
MAWKVRESDPERSLAVVEVAGVVDSTNVEEFFGFINGVFKKGMKNVVLDMAFASYLSSGGLSVIADAYKKAQAMGGKLVIARASEMVRDLFRVAQFEKIIDFYEELEEAVEAVR